MGVERGKGGDFLGRRSPFGQAGSGGSWQGPYYCGAGGQKGCAYSCHDFWSDFCGGGFWGSGFC